MQRELGFVPSDCIGSVVGLCWWRGEGGDCSGRRLLCRKRSRQILRWALGFVRRQPLVSVWRERNKHCSGKNAAAAAAAQQSAWEVGESPACTACFDSVAACASYCYFLGTNRVKFDQLGSTQFL